MFNRSGSSLLFYFLEEFFPATLLTDSAKQHQKYKKMKKLETKTKTNGLTDQNERKLCSHADHTQSR